MVTLDLSDDYLVIDNRISILIVRRDLSQTATWTDVLRRAISSKEVEQSDGQYVASDVIMSVPVAVAGFEPIIGDVITFDAQVYDVIDVTKATLDSRYRMTVRRLELSTVLDSTVQVYADVGTGSGSMGAPSASRADTGVSFRIRIQRETVSERIEQNRRMLENRFLGFVDESGGSKSLGVANWLLVTSGQYEGEWFRVVGTRDKDALGKWQVVELVRRGA